MGNDFEMTNDGLFMPSFVSQRRERNKTIRKKEEEIKQNQLTLAHANK